MKRKDYMKPAMRVVMMRQRYQILSGSSLTAVKHVQSNLSGDDAFIWGEAGDEEAR